MGTNYLPAIAKLVRQRIKYELVVSTKHVAITSDGWGSRYAGHFQSLTATSVIKQPETWVLKQHKLDFERLPEVS